MRAILFRDGPLKGLRCSSKAPFPAIYPSSTTALRFQPGRQRSLHNQPTASLRTISAQASTSSLTNLNDVPNARLHGNHLLSRTHAENSYEAIPSLWLRDNCQCKTCLHPDTKQRNFDTFDLPRDLSQKVVEKEDGFQVQWSDGHESFFAKDWLMKACAPKREVDVVRQGRAPKQTLWDTPYLAQYGAPSVQYEAVMDSSSDEGLRNWLAAIRNYGFCYVDGTPTDPEKSQKLLERIAFIRETHYGGFYDFTADLASKDTAYTSIALPAHTDNTYFSDPAGLQAFHLLSHTEGEGGASLLVDGFAAAQALKEADPEAYDILSQTPVQFHASGNEGISIQPYTAFPVLLHDPADNELVQVRWNESDRAAVQMHPYETQIWYDAARKFDTLLKSTRFEFWEQLKPGRLVVFDNWRVLHGRSSFTGKRRICGGYINRDDFISRFKMLQYGQDEVLRHINASA